MQAGLYSYVPVLRKGQRTSALMIRIQNEFPIHASDDLTNNNFSSFSQSRGGEGITFEKSIAFT